MSRPIDDPLENIELLAAACVLAPHLYAARGEAYNVCAVWTLLRARERQFYIDIALQAIRESAPGDLLAFPKEVHP